VYPVLELGAWHLPTYNVLCAIALVVAATLAFRRGLNGLDVPPELIVRGALLVILGGFAAGFAVYLLPKLPALLRTGALPDGEGRSIVWGIAGSVAVGWLYCRRHRIPPGRPFDLAAVPIPLGLAIGRLGCLAAGCCGGRPTDSWLGVSLPDEAGLWLPRYPTQAMSAVADLLIFAALLAFERYARRRPERPAGARQWPFDGALFLLFVTLFSLKRFLIAFLRESAVPVLGPLSAMQLYALAALAVVAAISAHQLRRRPLTFDLVLGLWPLGRGLNRLGAWPLLGRLLRPCFDGQGNEAILLPVHQAVQGTESVILPYPLLRRLLDQASHRFLLDHCLCRQGEGCRTYPHDLGCIFLGEGAAEIAPALGHAAGVQDALAHARRAMDAGLMPTVVHSSFDAWLLGIPYRRTLALCFCCDCCCSVRQGLRLGPEAFWETVVRLPGLSVTAGPACDGCGLCLDLCPVGALTLRDGRAVVGEGCKGCGRCAAACPTGAITLHLDEGVDAWEQLQARIAGRTAIGIENLQSTRG
jgi:prolipoprotein diacylglyceryltransferase/ferredoxin